MQRILRFFLFIFLVYVLIHNTADGTFGKVWSVICKGCSLLFGGTYEYFAGLAHQYPYGFAFLVILSFFWIFSKVK